jgi:hypothetical protein
VWKYNTWQPWLKQSGSFGKKIIIIFMNECNGMERNGTETGREGRRGREIISILSGKKERNG